MSKQLTKKQWITAFKKYENLNTHIFWVHYAKIKGIETISEAQKGGFKQKYRRYKNGNTNIIRSMTGKKATGRPKKKTIDWDDFTREELIEIAKRYKEIQKDKKKKEKMKETKNLNLQVLKLVFLLGISKSGYYKNKKVTYKSRRNPVLEEIITQSFLINKKRYGRKRLAIFISKKYGVNVSDRTIGNYLKALGLICVTRQAKKKRESKNVNVKYKDLVKRDYNNARVIATDVSYIPIKNPFTNHAYLSIAINHKTKFIESWNLSKHNDNELVLEHIKNTDLKDKIIHSDHGSQYSSNDFKQIIQKLGGTISMSRIGNSLDNREAEYFFSNIKSECLNQIKTRALSFDQVKAHVQEYIEWYNYKRIQSKLEWKTPAEARV